MSAFNADQFLGTDTAAKLDTEYTPVPEGEYPATCTDVKARATQTGKTVVDLHWAIEGVPEVKAATGLDKSVIRQSIFLDLNENGGIDTGKGKNVPLGRLLDAVGMNNGQPWNLRMFIGRSVKVSVKHRLDDSQVLRADVRGVAKL